MPFGQIIARSSAAIAAFLKRGMTAVDLLVNQPPRRLVSPLQMPPIQSSIVTRRVVRCDAERPTGVGQRAQESEFQHSADVARKLIARCFSLLENAVLRE